MTDTTHHSGPKSPSQSAKLVCASGIGATFTSQRGSIIALQDVDLSIAEDEFIAVLGPSGCGKTTLLKIIAGLVRPTAGHCEVRSDLLADRGRKMGLVPQRPALLPWATLEENALLSLSLAGQEIDADITRRLDTLLELVRLSGFRHARPHELSGGMQMRASLVRGLLPGPHLLLLDEPFAAIDEANRLRLILETRAMLRAQGCAALLVTHSVQEAALVADRILVLSQRPGRLRTEVVPDYGALKRDETLLDASEFHAVCKELRTELWHG